MAHASAAMLKSDLEVQRAAVRAAPDRPEAQFRLARALYRLGEHAEALTLLTSIDTPDSPAAWSFIRGLVHFKLGQWVEAETAFGRALGADPDQADWAAWRARALQAGGDLDRAAEAFEHAVELKPGRAAFAVLLAQVYVRQERFSEAQAVIADAPPPAPDEDPLFQRLRGMESVVRLAEGRKHVLHGVLELRATHWRRATKAFTRALALSPDQPAWRVLHARARLGGGEPEAACDELLDVTAFDPRPAWLALLSGVQQRLGDLGGATASIEQAIAADPGGAAWRAKLAGLRSAAGDAEGSVAAWREALVLNPGHRVWRFGFARALLKAGEPEQARVELRGVIADGVAPPPWQFLLGTVEAKLGNSDAAVVAWRRAIEGAGPAAMPTWHARLAGLLATRGGEVEAVEALEAAVAHPAAIPAIRAQLAQLYWRVGRSPEALSQIELALAEVPDPPFKWTLMADEIRGRLAVGASSASLATSMEYADAFYRTATVPMGRPDQSPYFGFWKVVADEIARSPQARLLDIGCGPGQFAEFILSACPGLDYTGVDFSGVAIELARSRAPDARFVQAELGKSSIISSLEYDLVVALEVLEHVDADIEVLGQLRSGARFVGSVPNFDSFGHVRFFKDADAVRCRYEGRIRELIVTPFNLAPNSILFLISGVLA